jgi:DNA-binding CsgD family transcriptional regulator
MLSDALPHYRPLEIKLGLYSLLLMGLYTLSLAPNDFAFSLSTGWLAGLLALRVLIFLVCLALLLVYMGTLGSRLYGALLWLLLASTLTLEVLSLITRPADYLFYVIPTFLTVAFSYFLLPAPLPQKIVFPLSLTTLHIFSVLFVKQFPPAARLTIPLTLVLLNVCGLASSLILRHLRAIDAAYLTKLREEQRFKQILADAGFDAVLVCDEHGILDCNQAFLELSDYSPAEIKSLRLSVLFSLDEQTQQALAGTGSPQMPGPIDSELRGKFQHTPVQIKIQQLEHEGRTIHALALRDRSGDHLGARPATADLQERINRLPLSQREKQVVRQLLEGHSRALLAQELYISDETAKKHIKNIYRKLDVSSRVELLRLVVGG